MTKQRQQRPTIAQIMRQQPTGVSLHELDILLAQCLGRSKIFLYSHPEHRLTAAQLRAVRRAVRRRQRGEPIAYITGHKEFYGRDFLVNRRALIPRPDTELMVDETLKYLRARRWHHRPLVVDIGTGCGNIAITLAKEYPHAQLVMTDISAPALALAKRNAKRYDVQLKSYCGNLLAALPRSLRGQIDVLVCNAPYLSKNEARKKTLAFEPQLALTPPLTHSPTSLIEKLFQQAPAFLKSNGVILVEIGYRQAKRVQKMCRAVFPRSQIITVRDLGGFDRVVLFVIYNIQKIC